MSRKTLMVLAGLGSAGLLLAAFGYQYIGGLLPCAMCLWQRWPHVAAMALAGLGQALPRAWVALLGALSMIGNAGLGLYHTGVEQKWWAGPGTCSGPVQDLSGLSGGDLLDVTAAPAIVMCDEAALHILGLSMASWNGLCCAGLAALWLWAVRNR